MKRWSAVVGSILVLVLLVALTGCGQATQPAPWPGMASEAHAQEDMHGDGEHMMQASTGKSGESAPAQQDDGDDVDYTPDVTFTLETGVGEGGLIFTGVGGDIDGVENPTLNVPEGAVVQINLVNGDGAQHDIAVPDFDAQSDEIVGKDSSTTIVFRANEAGEYAYFCSIPGHRQAGMEGTIVVGDATESVANNGVDIVRDPTDLPAPVGDREPETVRIDLETTELVGQLADGTTYTYWTFNNKVPGPMIRVRQGDTVELSLANEADSKMVHSIDLHAVTGPGGGAVHTQTAPGEENVFTFNALQPGLYVYHCATPMVAQHIANGMYGMILVEPQSGMPKVDHEFYVMQGEVYTQDRNGTTGAQSFSLDKMLAETPEYLTFNGAAGGLTTESHAMNVEVGDTVRIFFGVGGPNKISSFHVIGEIFDRVYDQASLTSDPLTDVQTTLVPPGGATVVEFTVDVPGRYILVDHALGRLEKGLAGFLYAEGDEVPEIFHEGPAN